MALFEGEEMVDVQTPDGRTLKMPRSIVPAAMLPQQIGQAPAGFTDEVAYNVGEPPPEAALARDAVGAMLAPVGAVAQSAGAAVGDAGAKPAAVAGDIVEKAPTTQQYKQQQMQAKQQAAYASSPQGQMDRANRGVQNAAQSQQDAITAQAVAEGAQQKAIGEIQSKRNDQIDKIFAQQAVQANANFEAEQKKTAEVTRMRDKIAGTKIDRSLDHPLIAAIGIALAGVGSAMKGESTNPALDMVFKVIDRKVQAQMEDLDIMGKNYGLKKDELDELKSMGQRKLELYNTMMAAEAQKAARQIEATMSLTADPIIQARAKAAAAEVAKFAADKTAEATRWGLDYQQRDQHQKSQIALGRAQLAESRRATNLHADLTREGYAVDLLKQDKANNGAMSAEQAKLLAKQQENVSTRGLKDLKTNTMLYTRAGLAKHAQAKKLEERAAGLDPWAADTPAKKQELAQEAQRLRQEADTYDVAIARDPVAANKVMASYAATKSLMGSIDRVNQLARENGRAWIEKGGGQAAIDTLYSTMAAEIKDAIELGAWDKGSAALVEGIIGKSPTSGWDTSTMVQVLKGKFGQDPNNALTKLNEFGTRLKAKTAAAVIASSENLDRGMNPDELFESAKVAAAETPEAKAVAAFSEQTPTERANEVENRSTLSSAAHAIGRYFTGEAKKSNQDVAREAQESPSNSVKYVGLTKAQEKAYDTLWNQYMRGGANDPDAQRAGELLVQKVLENAEKRPELAIALGRALQDNGGALYTQVMQQLPPDSTVAQSLNSVAMAQAGAAMDDDARLVASAKAGDTASRQQLARLASTKGPKQKWAAEQILNLRKPAQAQPQRLGPPRLGE